jgi:hypothetical protein
LELTEGAAAAVNIFARVSIYIFYNDMRPLHTALEELARWYYLGLN